MKSYLLIFFLLMITSCVNYTKNVNGEWQQVFMGYETELIEAYITDSANVKVELLKEKQIVFDYNDGLNPDVSDSIVYRYPNLNFRKLNHNKTFNRYKMIYNEQCDCFNGTYKSFNGNKVKVKWVRK